VICPGSTPARERRGDCRYFVRAAVRHRFDAADLASNATAVNGAELEPRLREAASDVLGGQPIPCGFLADA
jgi:hypothetical protein